MKWVDVRVLVAFTLVAGVGAAWGAGCGSDPEGQPAADGGASPTGPDGAGADAEVPPDKKGVRIREGRLEIDGKPTYLFGGEVQYFRVRDAAFDGPKTQALWKDTFARMRAAKMNLVTTYFAWDYHHGGPGAWDFTGARDADAYLRAACNEGLKVVAKPGPLITAEWPRGFGSFGAVPDWWKEQNQDALAKKADGSNFDFAPLPVGARSFQPTYLHPKYLAAVGEWFDRIVPIIRKHIETGCVVGVQVDNETNLYWSDRFGTVDYSDTALAHYRAFLKTRYGTVAALNAAYGTSAASFDAVVPPNKLPETLADDVPARDWYDAGQSYVAEYLGTIRGMLESRGIKEPDILFSTNDSPFTVVGTVANAARNILVHDGRVKNRFGIAGLDTYPKQVPDLPGQSGPITNFPFQADYYTKLYGHFGAIYTKDATRKFAFGAELQGGFYALPTGILPVVSPESTDQLLVKTVGHGMKGGSFYILRGGLNVDGSSYDFQAALGLDGQERARFDVMRRWAGFLARYGEKLQGTEDVEDPVAVVQDIAYAVPQGGTDDDHQQLYTNEYSGLYGWLLEAGFNAAVVDASTTADLGAYKAAFFLAPKMVSPAAAKLLVDLHDKGGFLAQFVDRGSFGLDGKANADVAKLAALFPVDPDGSYAWPRIPRTIAYGDINELMPGSGALRGYWHQTYWKARAGAAVTPFLVERTAITGQNGRPIGVTVDGPGAPRALIGTYLSSVYNSDAYYSDPVESIQRRRAIARFLLAKAGLTPQVYTDEPRTMAWGRRDPSTPTPAEVFLFVENDAEARTVHVHAGGPRSGLDPNATYTLRDELSEQPIATLTGAALASTGVAFPMPKESSRVLVATRK